MSRKFTFLFLLVCGMLCLVAGRSLQDARADECKEKIDESIKCPVGSTDDPGARCSDYNKARAGCGLKTNVAQDFQKNHYYTTPATGSKVSPFLNENGEFVDTLCYNRIACTWNIDEGKCENGAVTPVWQWLWVTVPCPEVGGPKE